MVVAVGLVIAFVCVIVWTLWSLIIGRPSLRRGSGGPGIPPHGPSGMPGSGGWDGGGGGGGDGGGGGGC